MKKLSTVILSALSILSMSSCFKQVQKPPKPKPVTIDSTTTLLTSQIWVYEEYFDNFPDSNTSLVWKRNPVVNSLNLALNQVKFNADSTYWEITQTGDTLRGTWNFTNGETGTTVINSQGTFNSTIETLQSQRFEWLGSAGTYGIMVPKNQLIDSTGDRLALLTAHSWAYSEYFFNFNQPVPQLVWKTNKANSPLNLSLDSVKYNTDGSYTETDQFGNVYTGTWTFTNNMTGTTVNNSLGTFSSNIELLDSTRYEWYDGVNHYGELVPR
jgi:hypothetical protein